MAGTIYELTGDWLRFYDLADDEEMDEESWFGMMEAIEGEIEDKAENTAKLIKQLNAEADAMKSEADRLRDRAKARANKAEWLKKALESSMLATGKTKFKTNLFSFGIQKNPPSLKVNEDLDIDAVPVEYLVYKAPELNKKALMEAIKNGSEFDFCHVEQSEGLRIR